MDVLGAETSGWSFQRYLFNTTCITAEGVVSAEKTKKPRPETKGLVFLLDLHRRVCKTRGEDHVTAQCQETASSHLKRSHHCQNCHCQSHHSCHWRAGELKWAQVLPGGLKSSFQQHNYLFRQTSFQSSALSLLSGFFSGGKEGVGFVLVF